MNPLVIGVGNRDRGDDGIGPLVVDVLDELEVEVDTLVAEGDLSDLALRWKPDQLVIVVDATVSGAPVGTITEIDALAEPLPREAGLVSSHGISLADAVALGRELGRLPRRLVVVGVEARSFDDLEPIEPGVLDAVPQVVDRITRHVIDDRRTDSLDA